MVDGADVGISGTINNVERVMWHQSCGVSNLHNLIISNSGGSAVGAYPLHWHLCGDATRGSVVDNVTVVGSVNRAFVPHGSHGITFTNITAIDIVGEAFWWDPPGTNESCSFQKFCTLDNSNDIGVDGLTVDGVAVPPGANGFRNAGVVLGAGSGNSIANSSVTGVEGSVDCSAYHWPEGANQNVGGNVWVFENNTGDSACHGIFVWQNDSNLHIIDGFSGGGIDHGAYRNNYDYRNVDVPYVEVHAVGWVMSDSQVGDVILRKHQFAGDVTFTNVTIGGVIDVADAPSGSQIQPVDLIVNGGGNSCGQVVWSNPHPQTTVSIDGIMCSP